MIGDDIFTELGCGRAKLDRREQIAAAMPHTFDLLTRRLDDTLTGQFERARVEVEKLNQTRADIFNACALQVRERYRRRAEEIAAALRDKTLTVTINLRFECAHSRRGDDT